MVFSSPLRQIVEFRRATRSHVADLPGEVANIVDRLIVQRGDDIAREDASLRGGAVGRRGSAIGAPVVSPSYRGFRRYWW